MSDASRLPRVNFWATSVAVPIGVAAASGVVTQLTAGPRLAARSTRIQAWHAARAKLADDLVKVIFMCSALESTEALLSNPKTEGERTRWTSQIDEITIRLADEGSVVALTHLKVLGVPSLVAQYIGLARGAWLSDRPLMERVAELKEIAGPLQGIYGRRWWHIPSNLIRMRTALASASLAGPPQPP